MTAVTFISLGLCVWRLSNMLAVEDGPFDLFGKIRSVVGVEYDRKSEPFGTNVISRGLICLWCNSVWIGTAMTVLWFVSPVVAGLISLPFSLSAIAILVNAVLQDE